MKAQDIVDQLASSMPLFTDGFSESLSISSITVSGVTATLTTPTPHGVLNGQNVAILGVDAPVQIDSGTFIRVGSTATFETLQDHDLTLSERDKTNGGKTITISGATEAEFNGTFTIVQIANRRMLLIAVDNSGATTISGTPIVEDANGGIFNGLFPAANVTLTTFEYTLPVSYPLDGITDNASIQTSVRISSALDIDQYLRDTYTAKGVGKDTLVVQLGDVTQSKKRGEQTDASSSAAGENSFTPILIQPFAIYIIMNVTTNLTGARARDKVEAEYIPAVFSSVLRASFDTGFTYSQYRATFTGHGVFAFTDATAKGKALYVHEITFEQLTQLTKIDMVGPDNNVAMRDVDYTLTVDPGTGDQTLDTDINLDEEPIP